MRKDFVAYERVESPVYAVQYDPEAWTMRDVDSLPIVWQEYRACGNDPPNPVNYGLWRGFYLATDNGFTLLHDGDWICYDAHNDWQVVSPERFERAFRKIDDDAPHHERERMDDDGCPNVE